MKKFEFLVEGSPVSQQTRNRQRRKDWKDKVRQEAEKYWSSAHGITGEAVIFQITYFYSADRLDIDNIVKPIQDAIIGLAYIDDRQITDLIVRKRNLLNDFVIEGISLILAEGLSRGDEFLYVVVADAPDQEVIT